MTFDDFELNTQVKEGLSVMNFREPSPIQTATIPIILEGKDLIACAQTGTGKTAAFVLPLLSKLSDGNYKSNKVNAVIMSPTRELAQQIDQQIEGFSYFVDVSALPIYGGTGGVEWEQQRRGLAMGVDIIVATPGRLISHLNFDAVDLSELSFFVLDEADRMLDMGFYDDIINIFKHLPPTCQVLMFSATMPPKIRKMAAKILKKPVEVNIAISKPPESIQQEVAICYDNQKSSLIKQIIKDLSPNRCIVFSSSKENVKKLCTLIRKEETTVQEMHSDLSQQKREEVMRDFKNGKVKIVVATDIISRGIDVDDIDLIINYDLPHDPEDYVHRIGRTARGDNGAGRAISFVGPKEQRGLKEIEKFLGYSVQQMELTTIFDDTPTYQDEEKKSSKPFRGQKQRTGKQTTQTPKKDFKRKPRHSSTHPKRASANQSENKNYDKKNRTSKNRTNKRKDRTNREQN